MCSRLLYLIWLTLHFAPPCQCKFLASMCTCCAKLDRMIWKRGLVCPVPRSTTTCHIPLRPIPWHVLLRLNSCACVRLHVELWTHGYNVLPKSRPFCTWWPRPTLTKHSSDSEWAKLFTDAGLVCLCIVHGRGSEAADPRTGDLSLASARQRGPREGRGGSINQLLHSTVDAQSGHYKRNMTCLVVLSAPPRATQ